MEVMSLTNVDTANGEVMSRMNVDATITEVMSLMNVDATITEVMSLMNVDRENSHKIIFLFFSLSGPTHIQIFFWTIGIFYIYKDSYLQVSAVRTSYCLDSGSSLRT